MRLTSVRFGWLLLLLTLPALAEPPPIEPLRSPVAQWAHWQTKANYGMVKSDAPFKIKHFEIPLEALTSDIANYASDEIKEALIFERGGKKYLRWFINPEDSSAYLKVEKWLKDRKLDATTRSEYTAYRSASPSMMIEAPNGAIFSVKVPTSHNGDRDMGSEKMLRARHMKIARGLSDYMHSRMGNSDANMTTLYEVAGFGIEGLDYGMTVRDYKVLKGGDTYLVPAFSNVFPKESEVIARRAGYEGRPAELQDALVGEPMGKIEANVLAKSGLIFYNPHNQNFDSEMKRDPNDPAKLIPTGRLYIRDIQDMHILKAFFENNPNGFGSLSDFPLRYEENANATIRFHWSSENENRAAWFTEAVEQQSFKKFKTAFAHEMERLTGIAATAFEARDWVGDRTSYQGISMPGNWWHQASTQAKEARLTTLAQIQPFLDSQPSFEAVRAKRRGDLLSWDAWEKLLERELSLAPSAAELKATLTLPTEHFTAEGMARLARIVNEQARLTGRSASPDRVGRMDALLGIVSSIQKAKATDTATKEICSLLLAEGTEAFGKEFVARLTTSQRADEYARESKEILDQTHGILREGIEEAILKTKEHYKAIANGSNKVDEVLAPLQAWHKAGSPRWEAVYRLRADLATSPDELLRVTTTEKSDSARRVQLEVLPKFLAQTPTRAQRWEMEGRVYSGLLPKEALASIVGDPAQTKSTAEYLGWMRLPETPDAGSFKASRLSLALASLDHFLSLKPTVAEQAALLAFPGQPRAFATIAEKLVAANSDRDMLAVLLTAQIPQETVQMEREKLVVSTLAKVKEPAPWEAVLKVVRNPWALREMYLSELGKASLFSSYQAAAELAKVSLSVAEGKALVDKTLGHALSLQPPLTLDQLRFLLLNSAFAESAKAISIYGIKHLSPADRIKLLDPTQLSRTQAEQTRRVANDYRDEVLAGNPTREEHKAIGLHWALEAYAKACLRRAGFLKPIPPL